MREFLNNYGFEISHSSYMRRPQGDLGPSISQIYLHRLAYKHIFCSTPKPRFTALDMFRETWP